jgi:hypothetical protein
MSSTTNPLTQLVLTNLPTTNTNTKTTSGNFYEALARAWGESLDRQAQIISDKSAELNQEGNDTPGAITQLTAESAKISFMAQMSQTSMSQSAKALETVAQK